MTKIVFTSCMDAERVPDQPVWDQICAEDPNVLMLLGDQIYMDWGDLGGSEWRKLIQRKPEKGLRAFATEMHRRYALQWEVPSFQALICGFAGRTDPSKLLVTWDDHDYAWNNSLGVDAGEGEDVAKHGVPAVVKRVSRRLFDQFVQQLRTAEKGAGYPADLPADWNEPLVSGSAPDLFWQGALNGGAGPQCLLLDTRWHREARTEAASILGVAQKTALLAAVSQPDAGLLVVAAGTPMSYKYRFSQQAWQDQTKDGISYMEYDKALEAAQRPVLYLAGDVHRNVWSGRLLQTDGTQSRVVQVLSSGAAIGRLGPKRFAPSYGVVTVPAGGAAAGDVTVRLKAQNRAGVWQDDLPMGDPLRFAANNWVEPMDGEAASQVDAAADSEVLTVLCARRRTHDYRLFDDHGVVETEDGIEGLAAVYEDKPQPVGSYPEALEVQVRPGVGGIDATAKLTFKGDPDSGSDRPNEVYTLIQDAFDRARDNRKTSVVLFIHGFGKSFEASLAQAYGLRQTFPDCEPILYSWAAGRDGGVLAALMGVPALPGSAKAGSFGLEVVLDAFGSRQAYGMTKVIVARSAGSLAMRQALFNKGPNYRGLDEVNRVILSAPLLKWRDYQHADSFAGLQTQVVVTRNRKDQTLDFADWIDGFGPMLGLEEGFAPKKPNQICLDFTRSARVGRLHDYLFLKLNDQQMEINRQLMVEKVFDPHQAVTAGLLSADGPGIFNVL